MAHFTGFIIYFYYGIKNSLLELTDSAPEETIICASDSTSKVQITKQKIIDTVEKVGNSTSSSTRTTDTRPQQTNTPGKPDSISGTVTRPSHLDPPKSTTKSDLFVSPSAFPSWDD